jgi:hypothetical protein
LETGRTGAHCSRDTSGYIIRDSEAEGIRTTDIVGSITWAVHGCRERGVVITRGHIGIQREERERREKAGRSREGERGGKEGGREEREEGEKWER